MKNEISHVEYLSALDWFWFTSILIITLLSVVASYYNKKNKVSTSPHHKTIVLDYLIMGRQLSLPLFVGTLVSTWYGGIFGVTQIAFEQGVYNFITQGVFWYIAYFLFAFYFVKKIRRYHVATLPELIYKIYGKKSMILSAIFIFIKTLPISYAISIGLFIQILFPLSLTTSMLIGVGFVIIYCLFGGFRAVVISDAIQFFIMLLGVITVVYFSYQAFGGMTYLLTHLPATHFSATGKYNLQSTIVWLFIACTTTFINPSFYQRCFAAKSDHTAIFGIVISVFIWFLFDCCTTLGGLYAKASIPDANSSHAYLTYSLQLLPNGWRGVLLATILATILSTLDSFLFIASSILYYDLNLMKNLKFHSKKIISLLFAGILSIILGLSFDGHFETIWRTIKGYFAACLLFPLLWGYLLPKKLSDNEFVIVCLLGFVAGLIWQILPYHFIDHFYISFTVTFLACCYFCYLYHPPNSLQTI